MDEVSLSIAPSDTSTSSIYCTIPEILKLKLQIQNVMDKFEAQFENVDVQTSIMEGAMSDSTAVSAPQDQIDNLINQVSHCSSLLYSCLLASEDSS